ncbi:MAG: DNA-3-methyladenine glycosylase [Thermoplasmatota archaeon]
MKSLGRSFFGRDADRVARELVGATLVHGARRARVTEAEAYFGPPGAHARFPRGDPASHAFRGPTARSAVMFGRAGHAYVYLIYGMHECFNVVTGAGDGQAVLVRAVEGAAGPGRATRALGITRRENGRDVTHPPLHFEPGAPLGRIVARTRVGITKARSLKLRFVDAGAGSPK